MPTSGWTARLKCVTGHFHPQHDRTSSRQQVGWVERSEPHQTDWPGLISSHVLSVKHIAETAIEESPEDCAHANIGEKP